MHRLVQLTCSPMKPSKKQMHAGLFRTNFQGNCCSMDSLINRPAFSLNLGKQVEDLSMFWKPLHQLLHYRQGIFGSSAFPNQSGLLHSQGFRRYNHIIHLFQDDQCILDPSRPVKHFRNKKDCINIHGGFFPGLLGILKSQVKSLHF